MRPVRVAACATLTVALASVIGVAAAGSQQPTAYGPVDAGFQPVVLEVGAPRAAILPDPAAISRAHVASDEPIVDAMVQAAPSGRPDVAQPAAPVRAVAIPRPTPRPRPAVAAAPVTPAGSSGWQYDPNVSWYGPGFYGHGTACGPILTTALLGVANRTLPCGTLVTFRNPANGRTITVPVVDRGPYVTGRQWDLTGGTCVALGHCYTGAIQWHLGP
jgi:rare lipoprotein A (peptidoglycan hydrolase)